MNFTDLVNGIIGGVLGVGGTAGISLFLWGILKAYINRQEKKADLALVAIGNQNELAVEKTRADIEISKVLVNTTLPTLFDAMTGLVEQIKTQGDQVKAQNKNTEELITQIKVLNDNTTASLKQEDIRVSMRQTELADHKTFQLDVTTQLRDNALVLKTIGDNVQQNALSIEEKQKQELQDLRDTLNKGQKETETSISDLHAEIKALRTRFETDMPELRKIVSDLNDKLDKFINASNPVQSPPTSVTINNAPSAPDPIITPSTTGLLSHLNPDAPADPEAK
jgi:hypothetical protein